jgi:hypothetical protein
MIFVMDKFRDVLKEEWFWAMMQFFIIAATLLLIYLQVKIQTAAHVVQALSTIDDRWNSETMLRARYSVCSAWLNGNREFDGVAIYVASFMEDVGLFVHTGAIPATSVWETQSWFVEHYYCMFKGGIDDLRKSQKDNNFYTQFENLYKKMNAINRKNNSPAFIRDEEELKRFANGEIKLSKAFLKLREDS